MKLLDEIMESDDPATGLGCFFVAFWLGVAVVFIGHWIWRLLPF